MMAEPLYWNFSYPCHWCGEEVKVIDGEQQPHECMIVIPS